MQFVGQLGRFLKSLSPFFHMIRISKNACIENVLPISLLSIEFQEKIPHLKQLVRLVHSPKCPVINGYIKEVKLVRMGTKPSPYIHDRFTAAIREV